MKAWKFFMGTGTLTGVLVLTGLMAACKPNADQDNPELPLPQWTDQRPVIDVELLRGDIDLDMDISQLSVSELRVLRNAFAARQGYLFMSAELRSIFSQTTWYDSLMYARWEQSTDWWEDYAEEQMKESGSTQKPQKMAPIAYTDQELAFIERVKDREQELLKKNFDMDEGWLVNIDNVVNLYQKEGMGWGTRQVDENVVTMRSEPIGEGQRLRSKLGQQGFAIVPSNYEQLFQVYENNDYHEFPNFVTTDLYLQAFHLYFDVLLRRIEEGHFIKQLADLCEGLHGAMLITARNEHRDPISLRCEHAAAFFAIGHYLLTGQQTLSIPASQKNDVAKELQLLEKMEDNFSDFLDYHDAYFMYSIFRPRGHYTRNEHLSRYFKAMMWLQTAPFCTDKPEQILEAALIGKNIDENTYLTNLYNRLTQPIDYLMGQPDNGSMVQVYRLMNETGINIDQLAKDTKKQKEFRQELENMLKTQVKIQPKFQASSEFKINLLPQRFVPDAYTLQEMVDYDNKPTLRPTPKGLDVFAAMGVEAAEKILLEELKENETWPEYTKTLNKVKKTNDTDTWDNTLYNEWLKTLTTLKADTYEKPKTTGIHPDYFMLTPQWDKKNLNAALGSWAELKHDAILYAKQPMGAECGGGDEPDQPIRMAYVEPNVVFWQAAIVLLNHISDIVNQFRLNDEELEDVTANLKEQAEFFLAVSKKELSGQRLSDEEYSQLQYVGSNFEYLSLQMLREPETWLSEWDDISGADKKVAVIADVYTANAQNNLEKSILYEGVGPADEIYVIVEIDGYLYLTRGAVFSYREFTEPLDQPRLTDEEWQEMLKKYPEKGVPQWMSPIRTPAEDIPADNELIFYSSGC